MAAPASEDMVMARSSSPSALPQLHLSLRRTPFVGAAASPALILVVWGLLWAWLLAGVLAPLSGSVPEVPSQGARAAEIRA